MACEGGVPQSNGDAEERMVGNRGRESCLTHKAMTMRHFDGGYPAAGSCVLGLETMLAALFGHIWKKACDQRGTIANPGKVPRAVGHGVNAWRRR